MSGADKQLLPARSGNRRRSRLPRWLGVAAALLLATPVRSGRAAAQSAPSQQTDPLPSVQKSAPVAVDYSALGRELVGLVQNRFYNARRARNWSARYAHYADGIRDGETFSRATDAALRALHASHTARLVPDDPTYYGLLSIFEATLHVPAVQYDSIGVDLEHGPQGWFVRTLFTGGPADHEGLKRGDLLLLADGRPFQPVESFRGRSGSAVRLQVRRRMRDEPIEVVVTPRLVRPHDEWLEAQVRGTRLLKAHGRSIGYIPLFSGAGEGYQDAAQDAIAGPIRDADALILDFRNGFGGLDPGFVSLFDRNVPRLRTTGRSGKSVVYDRQWRKPLLVLINSGTHSGKEVVAYALRRRHLATLVGERSGGAVLAGQPFLLSDGSLLYLAVADEAVDGVRLEGVSVRPGIAVTDRVAFADGADPVLAAALKQASRRPRIVAVHRHR